MQTLKIPDDLVAHAVWTSEDPARPSVVFVSERSRRRIAMWAPLVPLVLALVGILLHEPFGNWAVVLLVLTAIGAAFLIRGGRAGFYQLTRDGDLQAFLGRKAPDLSGMHRTRVRNHELRNR